MTKVMVVDVESAGLDARWNPEVPIYCVVVITYDDDDNNRVHRFRDIKRAIAFIQLKLADGWCMVAHHAKFDYSVLKTNGLQWTITPGQFSILCTQIMAYITDTSQQKLSLDALTGEKTDVVAKLVEAGYDVNSRTMWEQDWRGDEVALKIIEDYCVDDCKATRRLYVKLAKQYNTILKSSLPALAWLEFPMQEVLVDLEMTGAFMDKQRLLNYIDWLTQTKNAYEKTIADTAGLLPKLRWNNTTEEYEPVSVVYKPKLNKVTGEEESVGFNNKRNLMVHYAPDGIPVTLWAGHVPSKAKDGTVVYSHTPLGKYNSNAATGHTYWLIAHSEFRDVLETCERTKTGKPSITKTFLEDISEQLPAELPLAKLGTVVKQLTMAEGILRHIKSDGRIHCSFAHTRTRTTRLATNQPNLQNATRPGTAFVDERDCGVEYRSLFIPAEGSKLLVADLDRIELVVLAWFLWKAEKDDGLLQTIMSGADVHQANADRWKCSRMVAKTVVFLLMYGGQAGLMFKRGLTNTLEEAEAIFNTVNAEQPSLLKLKQGVWRKLEKTAVISNPFCGRGVYRELQSKRKWTRIKGERQSFNWLIQKTARDVMHMLVIESLPVLRQLGGHIVNLVHDELCVEIASDRAEELKLALNTIWQNRMDILDGIRINGDWNTGDTWYEAK